MHFINENLDHKAHCQQISYFLNDKENIAADLRKERICWRWRSLTADSGIRPKILQTDPLRENQSSIESWIPLTCILTGTLKKTMMLYIPISCPLRSKGESQAAIITSNTHSSSVWHRSRWYACIMHNFCLSLHLHAHFLLMCHSSTCSVTFLLFPISLMGAEKAPPPLTFSKRRMFWCVSSFLDGPQGKEVMGEICL